MPPQATVSIATPSAVVDALFRLALAYFDRLAAGDWARASVVLRVFSDTYNEHRDGVARFHLELGVSAAAVQRLVPLRISSVFDADTRRALQIVILGGSSFANDAWQRRIEAMPVMAAPGPVSAWWTPVRAEFTADQMQWASDAARDSVSTLGPNLERRVEALAFGGAPYTQQQEEGAVPFDEVTPIPGPSTLVTPTRRSAFVMPTWGWWAIGLGGLAAFGVLAYGVTEQGWFQQKARGRRR
jgi:hypothetical protein